MSSPAQVTLTSGREVTLSTSSQQERILCQKSCWRMRSHFYQVGSRIQYICSLQASFRQTALLSVRHTQTQRERWPVRLPTYHIASRPLFIHPFKWRAAKVWRNAGSHQKQTNSHILFCVRATGQLLASAKNLLSFFLFEITQFVLWSAHCEVAVLLAGLLATYACTRGVRRNNRQKCERAAEQRAERGGLIVCCVVSLRWSRFVLCATAAKADCMCMTARCEIESSFCLLAKQSDEYYWVWHWKYLRLGEPLRFPLFPYGC